VAFVKIGPYEVLGELGRGGMGVVYRVRSPGGEEAALKVLVKVEPGTLARFEREKRLLASLREEQGFVGLLDSRSSPDGAWLLLAQAWGNGGVARSQKGDLDGAIADYERFLELAPADPQAPAFRQALANLKAKPH
jgi:hypothetical protein